MLEPMLAARKGGGLVGTTPDPYLNNVVLLLSLNGDFKDGSPKKRPVASVGNVGFSSLTRYANSKSLVIQDRNSGLVASGAGGDFAFPPGTDFTIEVWAQNFDGSLQQMVGQWGDYNSYQLSLYSGQVGWERPGNGTLAAGTWPSYNKWHHIVVARAGTTIRIFVDGKVYTEASDNLNYTFNDNIGLGIGKVANQNGYAYVNGVIDEVRVTKGVARYTADFPFIIEPFSNF